MMKLLSFFLLFFTQLFALEQLQHTYYTKSSAVMLSDIVQNPKQDYALYRINSFENALRVSEKDVIQKLKKYGYSFEHKHSFIQFNKKSPIDTKKILNALKHYYKSHYQDILIQNIAVHPRSYMQNLPKNYTVGFQRKSFLSKHAVVYIQTPQHRKFFFNADIQALLEVFVARKTIQKDEELSTVNLKKKSIMLEKFYAAPLQDIAKQKYQAKHKIQKGKVLTSRDVTALYYLRRGDEVSVSLHNKAISILFVAKALRDAHLGDITYVQNENGKKIRVRVTGRNKAEVQ